MRWLALLACASLVVWNVCYRAGAQNITLYDEAWSVSSGVEMARSGNYLVNTLRGVPDYLMLEPPLSMWAVALTEPLPVDPFLRIRLGSLLAALVAAVLVFRFGRREYGFWTGLLATVILFTAPDFVTRHGARTAECDSLFVALISAAMFAFAGDRLRSVALGYVLLGVAFLDKSFHILPYGLAAFLYTVYLARAGMLSWKNVFVLPWLTWVPVLPWVVARFLADGTTFFANMFYYNFSLRFTMAWTEVSGMHNYYYWQSLQMDFALVLVAVLIALTASGARAILWRRHVLLLLLWIAVPMVAYMHATNGFFWYFYPFFPALALIAGGLLANPALYRSLWRTALVGLLLAVSTYTSEARIVAALRGSLLGPETRAMQQISREAGDRQVRVALAGVRLPWLRDSYSTALVLHNIVPADNPPLGHPDYQILPDGRIRSFRQGTPE